MGLSGMIGSLLQQYAGGNATATDATHQHFDQVALEAAKGIRELSQKTSVPIILGIIPADHVGQAIERVGIKQANKGREWAQAAIEMANVLQQLKGSSKR